MKVVGISKKKKINPHKKESSKKEGLRKESFKKKRVQKKESFEKSVKNQQKEKDQTPYKIALFKNYR